MAARILDDNTMERVVDPMLADLQSEFADAVRRGRMWRSRWILLVGYVTFLKTLALCGAEAGLSGWTVDDRSAMSRTGVISVAAIAAATVVFMALPVVRLLSSSVAPRFDPPELVYLIPSALPLAVPIGFTLGILLGLRGRVVSRRSTGAILACGIVCSVACLVMLLWIAPMANHEFRQLVFGRNGATVWKGITELTIGELVQQIDSERRSGLWVGNLLASYHMRWALSFATPALALFALSVTRYLVARWTVALAAFGTYFCYYALMWGGRAAAMQDALPVIAAAWLPNMVFAVLSVALLKVASKNAGRRSSTIEAPPSATR